MIQTTLIAPGLLAAALLLTGCSSVLTTASLRDLVRGGDGHAAEAASVAADGRTDEPPEDVGDLPADESATADAQRRQAAVEEATRRLSKLGHLDDAARASLAETLDRTEPEDWPAVIEAFAETLAAVAPPTTVAIEPTAEPKAVVATETAVADAHVAAKAELDAADPPMPDTQPEPQPEPAVAAEPAPPPTTAPVADEVSAASPPAAADPTATLTIRNACFASRVQAWGVVDRFAVDRFRSGQEVIVYFELEGLSAGTSPAGHTTCIDTALRLVTADGRRLHDWSFEPIAETCRARRHDYFARYVVRIPDDLPAGPCRIDVEVTDTIGSRVAEASMPLEIQPATTSR